MLEKKNIYNKELLRPSDRDYFEGYVRGAEEAMNKDFIIDDIIAPDADESILSKIKREIAEEVFGSLETYLLAMEEDLLMALCESDGEVIETLGELLKNAENSHKIILIEEDGESELFFDANARSFTRAKEASVDESLNDIEVYSWSFDEDALRVWTF